MDPRRWALAVAALHTERDVADVIPRSAQPPPPAVRERWLRLGSSSGAYNHSAMINRAAAAIISAELDATTGWDVIMTAARAAQREYRSWEELGLAWAEELDMISDGRAADVRPAVYQLLADGPWARYAWETNLDPLRQRWCVAIAAPLVADAGGDPQWLAGARLPDFDRHRAQLAALGLAARDDVIAYVKPRLHATGERALELARVVVAAGHAMHAGMLTEEDTWPIVLVAGKLAQQAYGSWPQLGEGLVRAWQAEGHPAEPMATRVAGLSRGLWTELPWAADLEVTLFADARPPILRAACPECGLQRRRPSPTPWVYCDRCAALVDYDLTRAPPLQPQGGELAAFTAELDAARGDRERFHAVQLRLSDAWIDACPAEVPPRTRDPAYRARYARWLADTATAVAFDAEASAREAAMRDAAGRLTFRSPARVDLGSFHALRDAWLAYQQRRDELGEPVVHPDASAELVRRIERAAFVRAWLPVLSPDDARALLERTGLAREYTAQAPPETRPFACPACAGALAVLADARDVVCDHCGRIVPITR